MATIRNSGSARRRASRKLAEIGALRINTPQHFTWMEATKLLLTSRPNVYAQDRAPADALRRAAELWRWASSENTRHAER
jgi:hypothetical protein